MITLAELRLRSKQKADRENSNFIENDELDFHINNSIAELHDLLIAHGGSDYFLKDYQFNLASNVEDYDLPSDFYKLKGVDIRHSDRWISMNPFNFNERNRKSSDSYNSILTYNLRYRILGNKLRFSPIPAGTQQVKIWYTPLSTKLVLDTDSVHDFNGFIEYVIVDVAIKYLQKEESDVQVLAIQKADLRKRIENMSANRDEGQPETVSDVYAENNLWTRRGL